MGNYIVFKYDKSLAAKQAPSDIECEFVKFPLEDKELIKRIVLFTAAAHGRHNICCVRNEQGEMIHYSFVIPHCPKFSFMGKNDFVIGPCWTREDYRGQGLYGKVLNRIGEKYTAENPEAELYILVRNENTSSVKGVQKSAFIPAGQCSKTKYLKHYKNVKWN